MRGWQTISCCSRSRCVYPLHRSPNHLRMQLQVCPQVEYGRVSKSLSVLCEVWSVCCGCRDWNVRELWAAVEASPSRIVSSVNPGSGQKVGNNVSIYLYISHSNCGVRAWSLQQRRPISDAMALDSLRTQGTSRDRSCALHAGCWEDRRVLARRVGVLDSVLSCSGGWKRAGRRWLLVVIGFCKTDAVRRREIEGERRVIWSETFGNGHWQDWDCRRDDRSSAGRHAGYEAVDLREFGRAE